MRTCPFTGCKTPLSAEVFACRKHWTTLTDKERVRLNSAMLDYLSGTMTNGELIKLQQSVLGDRGKA